jgi:hypothetical protein
MSNFKTVSADSMVGSLTYPLETETRHMLLRQGVFEKP